LAELGYFNTVIRQTAAVRFDLFFNKRGQPIAWFIIGLKTHRAMG
jgi:hypothetical protein